MLEHLTEQEKAYIAGIIDGEGSIQIYQSSTGHFLCRVCIYNTSKPLFAWLESKLLRAFYSTEDTHEEHKDWSWMMFSGKRAKELIETVRPYMIVKALQADVLLDFPMTKNGVRKLTAEEELQQAIDYIRLKDLNKTGRRKEE
jgi:hypothetical protein